MLLLLLSCQSPCPEGSVRGDDGLCYLVDEEEETAPDTPDFGPTEPSMSAEEAIETMEAALGRGLVDAIAIFDVYVTFLSARDATCPPMENPEADSYAGVWATIEGQTCTAESGFTYLGLCLFFEENLTAGEKFEGGIADSDRWSYAMVASYEMTDPDGHDFVGGGSALHEWERTESGDVAWEAFIGGTFHYPPAGGWLGEGIDASLFMDGTLIDGRRLVSLQGGVGYTGVDISFENIVYDSNSGATTGVFRLRDSTDYWFSLDLSEGPCGPMTWRHLDLGEHCIDLTTPIIDLLDTVEPDPR